MLYLCTQNKKRWRWLANDTWYYYLNKPYPRAFFQESIDNPYKRIQQLLTAARWSIIVGKTDKKTATRRRFSPASGRLPATTRFLRTFCKVLTDSNIQSHVVFCSWIAPFWRCHLGDLTQSSRRFDAVISAIWPSHLSVLTASEQYFCRRTLEKEPNHPCFFSFSWPSALYFATEFRQGFVKSDYVTPSWAWARVTPTADIAVDTSLLLMAASLKTKLQRQNSSWYTDRKT